jgi:hypothetical protein
MYKPDKVTSEKNTKTLRELVRRPENKVCADCKRNDPRWASWNLYVFVNTKSSSLLGLRQPNHYRGVFLCIRCSGIHRGMGTHISKVKSVDLDAWTPEQMEVLSLPCVVLSSGQLSLILQSPVDTEMGQQIGQSILGGALETRARSSRSVSPFSVFFYVLDADTRVAVKSNHSSDLNTNQGDGRWTGHLLRILPSSMMVRQQPLCRRCPTKLQFPLIQPVIAFPTSLTLRRSNHNSTSFYLLLSTRKVALVASPHQHPFQVNRLHNLKRNLRRKTIYSV